MADDNQTKVNSLIATLFGSKEEFEERMIRHSLERFRNAWSEQDTIERRRRFDYVVKLVMERQEIVKTRNFATMWCQVAVEGVINGDEREIRLAVDALRMTGERQELVAEYEPVFRKFVQICEEAIVAGEAAKNRGTGEAPS